MAGIASLKKKLKGIKATQKISKAMKTVSAVKFSRLNSVYKNYRNYAGMYEKFYGSENCRNGEAESAAVAVMGSERGLCGGFNSETVLFARQKLKGRKDGIFLITCGKEIERMFSEQHINPDKTFEFPSVPTVKDCEPFLDFADEICEKNGSNALEIIYPHYVNTLVQSPCRVMLERSPLCDSDVFEDVLWFPDKETVINVIKKNGFRSVIYGKVLETALGAQAATLMTMRSAYDTATEYGTALELDIQRRRQAQVTADVLEISSEHTGKGEQGNG